MSTKTNGSTMLDTIQFELDAIELHKDVKILLAVESGSRCWGFPSQNSDWDVRFAYARPKDDYLRLENVRDNIEWCLEDDLDVVGWDVSKFLRLLRGSNPTAFEWLGSPIVYRESHLFEKVREVAPECFNPVASAHHYHGMAKKHDMRYIRNGNTTKKRYLYAVRALLACRWSIVEQRPVPMAFEELKGAMLDPRMVPVVDDLVESKRSGLEKETCGPISELNEWILAQEEALKTKMDALETPKRVPWPVLDEIFLKIVSGTGFKSSF